MGRRPYSPKVVAEKQKQFLEAYEKYGTVRNACKAIGISRSPTYEKWMTNNVQDFKTRLTTARESFREMLEDIALDRIRAQGPKDNPVLLITMLNANWPEKYRSQASVSDSTAKDLLKEWRTRSKNTPAKKEKDDTDSELTPTQQAEEILKGRKGTR